MFVVPGVKPVATPDAFTTATGTALLDHTPPVGLLLKVVDDPVHIDSIPVIPDGIGFTVSTAELLHPVANV